MSSTCLRHAITIGLRMGRSFEAYIVMTYIVMAYIVMAYIVMAYIVMPYIVMPYIVMARCGCKLTMGR